MLRPALAAALAAAPLVLALTACGGEDRTAAAPLTTETARNGDVFTSADVEFATAMVPLHAEALAMVDTTVGRDLSPDAQALADEIQVAVAPDVQEMTSWLTSWDEPVPETVRDHVNAGHGDESGGTDGHHAGSEELARLEEAAGTEFEELWVELMLDNHEQAVAVAEEEQADGAFQPAVELADAIADAHGARIEVLRDLSDR